MENYFFNLKIDIEGKLYARHFIKGTQGRNYQTRPPEYPTYQFV